jgi:hypothetical protein
LPLIACFGVWWHGETPVSLSQVERLKHKPGESDGKFKSSLAFLFMTQSADRRSDGMEPVSSLGRFRWSARAKNRALRPNG